MSGTQAQQDALFPIREVSRLTGVNSITLRAWERRYNLIEPVRTESGHRLYTQHDIDTLKQVTELTQQGIPISRVKPLLKEVQPEVPALQPDTDIESQLLQALRKFRVDSLNKVLDSLLADYSEEFWQMVLRKITLKLSESTEDDSQSLVFWESVLLPRLNSRVHLSQRSLISPLRTLWLQSGARTSPIQNLLVALNLIKQGYYPLIQAEAEADSQLLFDHLQTYKCQGLVLVDDSEHFETTPWELWSDNHPSFEIWLFLKQSSPEMARKMQVSYFNLSDSFQ